MAIVVSLVDVRRNATGKEIPYAPTGDRFREQFGESTYEPMATVRLSVATDQGSSFEFIHEVHPLASLDSAVASAHAALLQFSVDLQEAVQSARLVP